MEMNKLDNYSHRLSIKEEIAYEQARDIMENSIERLKDKDYNSKNIVKSAYKYSRNKISNQHGGSSSTIILKINYQR